MSSTNDEHDEANCDKVTEEEQTEEPPKQLSNQEDNNNVQESKHIKTAKKKPPDILCNCPQKCDQRVPQEIRATLYQEFCSLGDHLRQNAYLQSYIEMRSVYKRLWCQEERIGGRLQRRVSCKYKVPLEIPKQNQSDLFSEKPMVTTNSKGQATVVVAVRGGQRTIEVCQKAFMNVYGITEKRIRLQREKLIAKLRADNPDRGFSFNNGTTNTGSAVAETAGCDLRFINNNNNNNNNNCSVLDLSNQSSHMLDSKIPDDNELSIVDQFFSNQLWKPEYIGISSERWHYIDSYPSNVIA